jgi:transcriptional regulator with XRE-family HTH domain
MTTATQGTWIPELNFAARLALVRNNMGWNAKEAALACGLPAQSWRNWESGKRPQDYETVCQRISARTGVDVDWLLRGGPLAPSTRRYSADSTLFDAA